MAQSKARQVARISQGYRPELQDVERDIQDIGRIISNKMQMNQMREKPYKDLQDYEYRQNLRDALTNFDKNTNKRETGHKTYMTAIATERKDAGMTEQQIRGLATELENYDYGPDPSGGLGLHRKALIRAINNEADRVGEKTTWRTNAKNTMDALTNERKKMMSQKGTFNFGEQYENQKYLNRIDAILEDLHKGEELKYIDKDSYLHDEIKENEEFFKLMNTLKSIDATSELVNVGKDDVGANIMVDVFDMPKGLEDEVVEIKTDEGDVFGSVSEGIMEVIRLVQAGDINKADRMYGTIAQARQQFIAETKAENIRKAKAEAAKLKQNATDLAKRKVNEVKAEKKQFSENLRNQIGAINNLIATQSKEDNLDYMPKITSVLGTQENFEGLEGELSSFILQILSRADENSFWQASSPEAVRAAKAWIERGGTQQDAKTLLEAILTKKGSDTDATKKFTYGGQNYNFNNDDLYNASYQAQPMELDYKGWTMVGESTDKFQQNVLTQLLEVYQKTQNRKMIFDSIDTLQGDSFTDRPLQTQEEMALEWFRNTYGKGTKTVEPLKYKKTIETLE